MVHISWRHKENMITDHFLQVTVELRRLLQQESYHLAILLKALLLLDTRFTAAT